MNFGKEYKQTIEMPPLDQITAVANALDNDRMPVISQQEQGAGQYQQPTQQVDEFPTTSMNDLPQYEADYDPQSVEVPGSQQYTPQQQATPRQRQPEYQQPEESVQAKNWREMRSLMDQRDREIEELRQLTQQLKRQAFTEQQQEPEEPDLSLDPEDLVNGQQLNAMFKEIKNLKKELKQTKIHSEEAKKQAYKADVEQQLRRMYPDFDAVISPANIEKFAQQYNPLAKSIANDPDYFNQCNAAYMAIKNTGIAQSAVHQPQIDRIKQNAAKPRPLASIAPQQGESPLTRANAFAEGLTEDLAKSLRAEMNNARMRI